MDNSPKNRLSLDSPGKSSTRTSYNCLNDRTRGSYNHTVSCTGRQESREREGAVATDGRRSLEAAHRGTAATVSEKPLGYIFKENLISM